MIVKGIVVVAGAVGLLVLTVEGPTPFAVWNLIPVLVVVASAVLDHFSPKAPRRTALIAASELLMIGAS